MFARTFTVNLKPGKAADYARTIDQEVHPILHRFGGFRDEITLVSSDGKQAMGISFWDRREDAEAYARAAVHDVIQCLEPYIDGAPVVTTYDVTNSTIRAIAALKAGA